MTTLQFYDSLVWFDCEFMSEDCQVLRFIDKCSAFGSTDTLPILTNTKISSQLPNTTAKLRLSNAGIVAEVNIRYLSIQVGMEFDLLENLASPNT